MFKIDLKQFTSININKLVGNNDDFSGYPVKIECKDFILTFTVIYKGLQTGDLPKIKQYNINAMLQDFSPVVTDFKQLKNLIKVLDPEKDIFLNHKGNDFTVCQDTFNFKTLELITVESFNEKFNIQDFGEIKKQDTINNLELLRAIKQHKNSFASDKTETKENYNSVYFDFEENNIFNTSGYVLSKTKIKSLSLDNFHLDKIDFNILLSSLEKHKKQSFDIVISQNNNNNIKFESKEITEIFTIKDIRNLPYSVIVENSYYNKIEINTGQLKKNLMMIKKTKSDLFLFSLLNQILNLVSFGLTKLHLKSNIESSFNYFGVFKVEYFLKIVQMLDNKESCFISFDKSSRSKIIIEQDESLFLIMPYKYEQDEAFKNNYSQLVDFSFKTEKRALKYEIGNKILTTDGKKETIASFNYDKNFYCFESGYVAYEKNISSLQTEEIKVKREVEKVEIDFDKIALDFIQDLNQSLVSENKEQAKKILLKLKSIMPYLNKRIDNIIRKNITDIIASRKQDKAEKVELKKVIKLQEKESFEALHREKVAANEVIICEDGSVETYEVIETKSLNEDSTIGIKKDYYDRATAKVLIIDINLKSDKPDKLQAKEDIQKLNKIIIHLNEAEKKELNRKINLVINNYKKNIIKAEKVELKKAEIKQSKNLAKTEKVEVKKDFTFDYSKVKTITTASGDKLEYIDLSNQLQDFRIIRTISQKKILDTVKPSYIPDIEQSYFKRASYRLPFVDLKDGCYLAKINGKSTYPPVEKDSYIKIEKELLTLLHDYYIKLAKQELKVSEDKRAISYQSKGYKIHRRRLSVISSKKWSYEQANLVSKFYPFADRRQKSEIFDTDFNELKICLNDIDLNTIDIDSSYSKGEETSYGDTNLNFDLVKTHSVRVKRQDGSEIQPEQVNEIKKDLDLLFKTFGDLRPLFKSFNLKISHADNMHMFCRKSIGLFNPHFHCISINNTMTSRVLAHETAHFLDYVTGQKENRRYLSEKSGTLHHEIAVKFRDNMKVAQKQGYLTRTTECFARAFEMFFSLENKVFNNFDGTFPRIEFFDKTIKPLIKKFINKLKK